MDEKQLLHAIAQMMDEKTSGLSTRMDENISGLSTRMDEKIFGLSTRMDGKISGLATRMDEKISSLATREEMTKQNNEMRVLIENGYQKIENLLKEDYGRVASAVAKTADYDDVKSTVSEHQHAIENHNQRLAALEKKAI